MSSVEMPPVVVFDGVCALCNGWIRFLLRHDRERRYHFAAMQTDAGRALLERHGLDPDDPVSFLLVDAQHAWTDTDAIARVIAGLGARWRPLSWLITLVPRFVRDPAYRAVARNRYRWFGRHTYCYLPPSEERYRFFKLAWPDSRGDDRKTLERLHELGKRE